MSGMKDTIKRLQALREDLKGQIQRLEQQLEGVEMALRAATGEKPVPNNSKAGPRSNVKQILLRLLEETGASGLNAASAVEMASKRNEPIERASVSSLLSRFKSDGLVAYDGQVYRLKKFVQSEQEGPNMH